MINGLPYLTSAVPHLKAPSAISTNVDIATIDYKDTGGIADLNDCCYFSASDDCFNSILHPNSTSQMPLQPLYTPIMFTKKQEAY